MPPFAAVVEGSLISEPTIERWQISDTKDDPLKSLKEGNGIAFYHGAKVQAIMLHPHDFAQLNDAHSFESVDVQRHWTGIWRAVATTQPGVPIRIEDRGGRVGILVHPAEYELLRASVLLHSKADDYRKRLAESSNSYLGSLQTI